MNRFTSFAVFLYSAISLVIPSGYSVGAGLLVLGSLVLLKKRDLTLSRDDLRLMAVFFFYFLVSICMNVLHAESWRFLPCCYCVPIHQHRYFSGRVWRWEQSQRVCLPVGKT